MCYVGGVSCVTEMQMGELEGKRQDVVSHPA
jgi:hypothetical protein